MSYSPLFHEITDNAVVIDICFKNLNFKKIFACFDDVYSKGRWSGETNGNKNSSYLCHLGACSAIMLYTIHHD